VPVQRFHEEEPQGSTVLHYSAGIQLPLAKQMGLEHAHVFGAEPIGWLVEMRRQWVNRTDVSPPGTLRIVSTLEFLQHHRS
jgi:hypothetical protein